MSATVELVVTTLARRRITLRFGETTTVAEVLDALQRRNGCPVELQVLQFIPDSKLKEASQVTSADAPRQLSDYGLIDTVWACLIRKLPDVPPVAPKDFCDQCGGRAVRGNEQDGSLPKPKIKNQARTVKSRPLPPRPPLPPSVVVGQPLGNEGDSKPLGTAPMGLAAPAEAPGLVQPPQSSPSWSLTASAQLGPILSPPAPPTPVQPDPPRTQPDPPAPVSPRTLPLAASAASAPGRAWWEASSGGVAASSASPQQPTAAPASTPVSAAAPTTASPHAPASSATASAVPSSARQSGGAAAAQSPRGRGIRRADLDRVGRLGVGAFGVVTLEEHRRTRRTYALKAVSKGYLAQLNMQYSVLNEKSILRLVESPFIVRLLATFNGREHVYFLLEAALGGELFTTYERLRLYGSEPHARFYVACVVEALHHLHDRSVIYRDLKPENLLLDARGYCKLTDMGLAKVASGLTYTLVGTPDYMAPEVIRCTGHNCAVDWWMLGVLLFELLAGRAPFEAAKTEQIYDLVKRGIDHVHFPDECRDQSADLVRKLCRLEPQARLRVPHLREHSWFKADRRFNWTALRNMRLPAPHTPSVRGQRDLSNFRQCDQEDPPLVHYVPDGSDWDHGFEEDLTCPLEAAVPNFGTASSLTSASRHAASGAAAAAAGAVAAGAVALQSGALRGVPSRGGA